MTRRTPEPISKLGAQRIAAQLDAYWHRRGHNHVRHWIEIAYRDGDAGTNPFWTVRSNLVAGKPPPEAA